MKRSKHGHFVLTILLIILLIAALLAGITSEAAALTTIRGGAGTADVFAAPDYDTGKPEGADFTVIFDSKGGSEVPRQYLKSGEKLKEPEAPVKKKLEFDGWFTAPDGGTLWDFENQPVKTNMTLYAHYCARARARAVPAEGGLVYTGNIDYAAVYDEGTWSEDPESIGGYAALENPGYTFKEWRFGGPDGAVITADDTAQYYYYENTHEVYFKLDDGMYDFYAIFERDPSYKGLLSIEIRSLPAKTTYTSGEAFDPAGISVFANYGDDTSVDVTNSAELLYAPEGHLFEDNEKITLSFTDGGVTVTKDIAIRVGIYPSDLPDPTQTPAPTVDVWNTSQPAATTAPGSDATQNNDGSGEEKQSSGGIKGLLIACIVLLGIVIAGGAAAAVIFLKKKKGK